MTELPAPPTFLTTQQAAMYLGIDQSFFRQAIYRNAGPAYTAVTERKKMFLVEDLDAWKATWRRVEQKIKG